MHEVGTYEAKTRLPELLKAVESGDTVVITRRGRPIARLVAFDTPSREDVATVIGRLMRARAARPRVTAAEILDARDEGRKG